ncbi:hypothetical protein CKA32_005590 [Geitlerinema sp. FC II]|nr:hypothetical protein CKA32_005590 [Geitlerinema sp. FC II]
MGFSTRRAPLVPSPVTVSIPRRNFWVFQRFRRCDRYRLSQFQSLEGIFGFFNA